MKIKRILGMALAGTLALSISANAADAVVVRANKDGTVVINWDAPKGTVGSIEVFTDTNEWGTQYKKFEIDTTKEPLTISDNLYNVALKCCKTISKSDYTCEEFMQYAKSIIEGNVYREDMRDWENMDMDAIDELDYVVSLIVCSYAAANGYEGLDSELYSHMADVIALHNKTVTLDEFTTLLKEYKACISKYAKETFNEDPRWTLADYNVSVAHNEVKNATPYIRVSSNEILVPLEAGEIVYTKQSANKEIDFKTSSTTATQLTKLSTNTSEFLIKKGGTLQLTGEKGTTYKSSNTKVATVSSTGKITAKKTGVAVITAKKGNKNYQYRIRVTAKAPKGATGVIGEIDDILVPAKLGLYGEEPGGPNCGYNAISEIEEAELDDFSEITQNTKFNTQKYEKPVAKMFTLFEKTKVTLSTSTKEGERIVVGITNNEDYGFIDVIYDGEKLNKTMTLPAGTYYVVAVSSKEIPVTIKADKVFVDTSAYDDPAITLKKGKSLTVSGTGEFVHYYISNPAVAKVSKNGKITAVSAGTTTLVVTSDSCTMRYTITVTK